MMADAARSFYHSGTFMSELTQPFQIHTSHNWNFHLPITDGAANITTPKCVTCVTLYIANSLYYCKIYI